MAYFLKPSVFSVAVEGRGLLSGWALRYSETVSFKNTKKVLYRNETNLYPVQEKKRLCIFRGNAIAHLLVPK